MSNLVSLAEAASYLGVSKATLRNWDKEGKLKAHRHPLNRYRAYDLEELRTLRAQTSLLPEEVPPVPLPTATIAMADARSIKRVVARLHAALRDTDGDSSIIQRFDELTKLLFLKLFTEQQSTSLFAMPAGESKLAYAERIRSAYHAHAQQYPTVIPPRFAALSCSDAAINQCGTILAGLVLGSAQFDVKGMAYEEVIKGTFDKSDHQQFFTPPPVVNFMVGMMQPFLHGVVADPACGTAGFLAEVVRAGVPVANLLGLEIDERLAWVAGINLLLHGAAQFNTQAIAAGGSLGAGAKPYHSQVDAILTNPPFGSDLTDTEILGTFTLGAGRTSRRRGILFIERCWDLLQDGGVVAIVIDEGVLNLSTATDVRQFILAHFDVLAIVNLPETAFMPYANVNASILFLRKSAAPDRSRRVFFGRADKIGRKANGDDDVLYDEVGNSRLNSDLPEIRQRWQSFLAGQPIGSDDLAYVADVTSNLATDSSLRLDFRYHHPSRNRSRDLLAHAKFPLVSLPDLCTERNETVVPSTEMADQVILYTGLANIEAGNGVAHQVLTPAASLKSAVKRYAPNDIVFARMRPNLRKVALMTFAEGGFVSPECTVLTVRTDHTGQPLVDPEVLAAILRSDLVFGQIMHLIAGIGRPRLNTTDLRKVRLPIPPTVNQEQSKAEFAGRLAAIKQLRAKASALLAEAAVLEVTAVDELANRLIGG